MMKNILLFTLFLSLFCFGCKDDDVNVVEDQGLKDKFMTQTIAGVYSGGSAMLMYQEDVHQIVYTSDKKSWRIQNDNLSVYVSCVLNEEAVVNKEVAATIKAKGVDGIAEGGQIATVLKIENKKCWLWFSALGIGILSEMK